MVESHTAGCPVAGVRWTYLRSSELVEQLLNREIQVSVYVIDRLLAQAGIGRRKLAKKETMKADIPGRDDQFKIIQGYKSSFLQNGYPVLSLDVKKKEMLGRFYRSGQVYGDQEITCYDHDFASFSTGKVVPYGVYDVGRNEGHMLLGQSADTAEFNLACLRQYWDHHGSKIYDGDHPILLLVDGGGSNGSTNRLFKQELQDWVDEIGRIVRVAHFPPYCSKYNPIEHRLFPFITRAWEGVMLDSLQTMIQLIESRTRNLKCGIKIFVEAMTRVFHAGVAVFDNYLESCNIIHDPVNGKWNYQVIPI